MNRRDFLTLGTNSTKRKQPRLFKSSVTRNQNLTEQQLASRFLAQATFGPTRTLIDEVTAASIEAWIENQFAIPQTQTLQYMWDVVHPLYYVEEVPLLGLWPFRWAWWQAVMTGQDLLRQRVAMALSEIMVISTRTDLLEDLSIAVASWYDMLLKHAFGNFRDLLRDVTLHPAMGYYLSHAGNRKSDPVTNRFPDENYAREVMQLFSIGLFELNIDGTRKLDSNGEDIPTYDNGIISEFAKIFTGLTYQESAEWAWEDVDINSEEGFSLAFMSFDNASLPMQMWDVYHEPGEKRLLNGLVVPAGQTGMQDVEMAIDNLFNHPNVGPFMARLLIQRLVKSNPSPSYIGRVATAFNDNGAGMRGDMKAVVGAILLDSEARDSAYINDPAHGMLREPFVRYAQLCRAFEAYNAEGENLFFNGGEMAAEQLPQYPFASPSVFNFFSPDFQPLGPLQNAGLSGPEFQITTSVSAIKMINFVETAVLYDVLMDVPEGDLDEDSLPTDRLPTVSDVLLNLEPYMPLNGNIPALLDQLDLLLTYGTLSNEMRQIITTALTAHFDETDEWEETVRFGISLLLNSMEYAILK